MKNNQAFTLIELLVVVLIIGILAAVAVPQYKRAVHQARFTQLLTLSKTIVDAENAYYMENGVYADRADALDIQYPIRNNGTQFGDNQTWGCSFDYANGVGGNPRANCSLVSPSVVLQWEFQTNKFNCCTYSDDNFQGEWLCQKYTGTTEPYGSGSSYRCYSGKR